MSASAQPLSFMQKVLAAMEAMEARVTDLEVKASYSDDLLEELNLIIYRQQEALARLSQDMQTLRTQAAAARQPDDPNAPPRDPREDIPPHY